MRARQVALGAGPLAGAILLFAAPARAQGAADPSAADRHACETLTDQGRRGDAVLACSRAVQTVRSDANVRALVHALVGGPAALTTTDLAIALSITAREREAGSRITAAAATCDIAERMGDMVMLQRCADDLRTTAPDDPATARAAAILAARCPPWRFWGGWSLVAATLGGTLAHALRRSARRSRNTSRAAAPAPAPAHAPASARALTLALTLGAGLLGAASPSVARADVPPAPQHGWLSKWPIDDAHPEAAIPPENERNADPLQFGYWLQDLTWKAERSSAHGDHAAAARYYHALAVAVPDRAVGFLKECEEHEALGHRDEAVEACGQALLRDGLTVHDYDHFVQLELGQPRPLTEKETAALAQVIAHMKEDPAGRDAAADVECQVGARTSNVAQLEACTTALAARGPEDARLVSYRWALAVAKGDRDEAAALIARAPAAGVAPQDVERMSRTTQETMRQQTLRLLLSVVAIVLLVAGLGAVGRLLGARKRVADANLPG
jgi:hypothetical protein